MTNCTTLHRPFASWLIASRFQSLQRWNAHRIKLIYSIRALSKVLVRATSDCAKGSRASCRRNCHHLEWPARSSLVSNQVVANRVHWWFMHVALIWDLRSPSVEVLLRTSFNGFGMPGMFQSEIKIVLWQLRPEDINMTERAISSISASVCWWNINTNLSDKSGHEEHDLYRIAIKEQ